jgi:NAD(P)-dependent dehydrogenase (short-subunit alcohol dehydrogenase family)
MSALAFVTAGASGLGSAFVGHLAERGFRVLATYRRSSEVAAALARRFPGQVQFVPADLSRADDRAAAAARAMSAGGLSVLVNNLGVYSEEWIEQIDTERFEEIFRLNCTVPYDLIRRLAPHLPRGGRIVNLGDSGADRIEARAQATPYHIGKIGLHVLTRTFAQRLGPSGVTVNMISPGFLVNSVGSPGEPIPLGAPTRFEDILGALDFLLAPAAQHVSGANLLVNGAWNLG